MPSFPPSRYCHTRFEAGRSQVGKRNGEAERALEYPVQRGNCVGGRVLVRKGFGDAEQGFVEHLCPGLFPVRQEYRARRDVVQVAREAARGLISWDKINEDSATSLKPSVTLPQPPFSRAGAGNRVAPRHAFHRQGGREEHNLPATKGMPFSKHEPCNFRLLPI